MGVSTKRVIIFVLAVDIGLLLPSQPPRKQQSHRILYIDHMNVCNHSILKALQIAPLCSKINNNC